MIGCDQVGALIGHSRRRPLLIPDDRELPEAYPDAEMFGSLPAYALCPTRRAAYREQLASSVDSTDLRSAAVFGDVSG